MFFSIIIPVYNAEISLNRCLYSVLSQTFDDFEVIVIDDGSQDKSHEIYKAFAKQDARVKYIYQKNKGVSSARNRGLETAKGDYICFVDSDDFISSTYLETLHKVITENLYDVVFFGYNVIDQTENVINQCIPVIRPDESEVILSLSEQNMFGYTWIKCCSRKIIGETAFPEEMSLFEDEVFTCSVLEKTKTIGSIPAAIYNYVKGGKNVLTNKIHNDYCILSDTVFAGWEHLLDKSPVHEQFLQNKANYFVKRCTYYGFEQDINFNDYFKSLLNTRFFLVHTDATLADRIIEKKKWKTLRLISLLYNIKNRLYSLLKKDGVQQ